MLALVVLCGRGAWAAPDGPIGRGLEGFVAAMAQLMSTHRVPGGALAVCKGGRLVLLRGYGYANQARQTPVDGAVTIFALASISKTFTATAILRLVDEGRLSLDDRVLDRLLPARDRIDPRLASVTIRTMLAQLPREGVPPKKLAAELGVALPLTSWLAGCCARRPTARPSHRRRDGSDCRTPRRIRTGGPCTL